MKKTYKILSVIAGVVLLLLLAEILLISVGQFEIVLDSENVTAIEFGEPFTPPRASARLAVWPVVIAMTETDIPALGTVDTNTLGEYVLTYRTKFLWRSASATYKVHVIDSEAPVITLVSNNTLTVPGQTYVEEGYRATDNYDGDITDRVVRQEKDGMVFYTVSDSFGNTTTVVRTIAYRDMERPLLTLQGESSVTITAGEAYLEPGYTATDNLDGDITASVQVIGQVDIYTAGVYTLTYRATDSHGNFAEATRTVVVQRRSQPEVVVPEGKVIYLTFDDGPGKHTNRLLDILAEHNVKATFFVVGEADVSVYPRIVKEGHAIGLHTGGHRYEELYASPEAYFADLKIVDDMIYKITGVRTTLLRFPGGSRNASGEKYCPGIMAKLRKSVTDMGYQYFDWNVSSEDAVGANTPDAIYENVIAGIEGKDRAVVLMHDIYGASVDTVERIIQWGIENGYTFLPLEPSSPSCKF